MTIIDSIYQWLCESDELAAVLGKTEWDEPAIYDAFLPPESIEPKQTPARTPYLTYSVDATPIDPWPYVQYTLDYDIWDLTDGNDATRVMAVERVLLNLLDRREVRDDNQLPTTIRCTAKIWLPDLPNIRHRKVTFVFRTFDANELAS